MLPEIVAVAVRALTAHGYVYVWCVITHSLAVKILHGKIIITDFFVVLLVDCNMFHKVAAHHQRKCLNSPVFFRARAGSNRAGIASVITCLSSFVVEVQKYLLGAVGLSAPGTFWMIWSLIKLSSLCCDTCGLFACILNVVSMFPNIDDN